MKKTSLITSGLLTGVLIFSAGAIAGQHGGHNGMCDRDSMGKMGGHRGGDPAMFMMRQLDLSKEQRDAIREIVDAQRDQMRDHQDKLSDLRKTLREQVNSDSYDPARVRELADAKSKIIADMIVQRSETMNRIRQQLTAEQRASLDDKTDRRSGGRGPGDF